MKDLFISFAKTKATIPTDYTLKSVIRSAIAATLSQQGFPYDADVSVTLCDNEHIHGLNNRFRGVDRPTDVLSFPLYDGEFPEDECEFGASLGDIVISLERAEEQAKEVGNSFLREVAFLTIHSTLHLLGFDHELGEEYEEAQCEAQKEIIEMLDID